MKVIEKSNYRIVVEPKTHIYGVKLSEDAIQMDIKEMEQQIKRHVDNIGYLSVEHDTNTICSYCRRTWEVSEDDTDPDFPKGTPVCCDKAINEYNEQKSQLTENK